MHWRRTTQIERKRFFPLKNKFNNFLNTVIYAFTFPIERIGNIPFSTGFRLSVNSRYKKGPKRKRSFGLLFRKHVPEPNLKRGLRFKFGWSKSTSASPPINMAGSSSAASKPSFDCLIFLHGLHSLLFFSFCY